MSDGTKKTTGAVREVMRRAKISLQAEEGKPMWCVRCKSLWGALWGVCQRCGWGHASDKTPFVKEFRRSHDR